MLVHVILWQTFLVSQRMYKCLMSFITFKSISRRRRNKHCIDNTERSKCKRYGADCFRLWSYSTLCLHINKSYNERRSVNIHTHTHLGHMFALSKWIRITIKTRLWSNANINMFTKVFFFYRKISSSIDGIWWNVWREMSQQTYSEHRGIFHSALYHHVYNDRDHDLVLQYWLSVKHALDDQYYPQQEYLNEGLE